jgi:hypothetical protein
VLQYTASPSENVEVSLLTFHTPSAWSVPPTGTPSSPRVLVRLDAMSLGARKGVVPMTTMSPAYTSEAG